jgi:hypothetical protein
MVIESLFRAETLLRTHRSEKKHFKRKPVYEGPAVAVQLLDCSLCVLYDDDDQLVAACEGPPLACAPLGMRAACQAGSATMRDARLHLLISSIQVRYHKLWR